MLRTDDHQTTNVIKLFSCCCYLHKRAGNGSTPELVQQGFTYSHIWNTSHSICDYNDTWNTSQTITHLLLSACNKVTESECKWVVESRRKQKNCSQADAMAASLWQTQSKNPEQLHWWDTSAQANEICGIKGEQSWCELALKKKKTLQVTDLHWS